MILHYIIFRTRRRGRGRDDGPGAEAREGPGPRRSRQRSRAGYLPTLPYIFTGHPLYINKPHPNYIFRQQGFCCFCLSSCCGSFVEIRGDCYVLSEMINKYCRDLRRRRIRTTTWQTNVKTLACEIP